jgi:hypothetical protein
LKQIQFTNYQGLITRRQDGAGTAGDVGLYREDLQHKLSLNEEDDRPTGMLHYLSFIAIMSSFE